MSAEELSTIVTPIATIIVNIGISYWIYTVLSKMISELKDRNDKLTREIEKIKASEIKWFKKYHAVVSIILKHRRDISGEDAIIYKEYLKYVEDEDKDVSRTTSK